MATAKEISNRADEYRRLVAILHMYEKNYAKVGRQLGLSTSRVKQIVDRFDRDNRRLAQLPRLLPEAMLRELQPLENDLKLIIESI